MAHAVVCWINLKPRKALRVRGQPSSGHRLLQYILGRAAVPTGVIHCALVPWCWH